MYEACTFDCTFDAKWPETLADLLLLMALMMICALVRLRAPSQMCRGKDHVEDRQTMPLADCGSYVALVADAEAPAPVIKPADPSEVRKFWQGILQWPRRKLRVLSCSPPGLRGLKLAHDLLKQHIPYTPGNNHDHCQVCLG